MGLEKLADEIRNWVGTVLPETDLEVQSIRNRLFDCDQFVPHQLLFTGVY